MWPLGKALLGDVEKLTSVEMMLGRGCAQSHLSLDLALEAGQPLAKNWLLIALGLGSRLLSPDKEKSPLASSSKSLGTAKESG